MFHQIITSRESALRTTAATAAAPVAVGTAAPAPAPAPALAALAAAAARPSPRPSAGRSPAPSPPSAAAVNSDSYTEQRGRQGSSPSDVNAANILLTMHCGRRATVDRDVEMGACILQDLSFDARSSSVAAQVTPAVAGEGATMASQTSAMTTASSPPLLSLPSGEVINPHADRLNAQRSFMKKFVSIMLNDNSSNDSSNDSSSSSSSSNNNNSNNSEK